MARFLRHNLQKFLSLKSVDELLEIHGYSLNLNSTWKLKQNPMIKKKQDASGAQHKKLLKLL